MLDAPDRPGASPLPALPRLDVVPPRFVDSREGLDLVCRDSPLVEAIPRRVETQQIQDPGGVGWRRMDAAATPGVLWAARAPKFSSPRFSMARSRLALSASMPEVRRSPVPCQDLHRFRHGERRASSSGQIHAEGRVPGGAPGRRADRAVRRSMLVRRPTIRAGLTVLVVVGP